MEFENLVMIEEGNSERIFESVGNWGFYFSYFLLFGVSLYFFSLKL